MVGKKMSYDEAAKLVQQMHRNGSTYPEIAEHLKNIGYVSPRTGKPIKELAARHMDKMLESKQQKSGKTSNKMPKSAPTAQGKAYVAPTSPERIHNSTNDLVEAAKRLLEIENISPEVKLKLVMTYLAETGKSEGLAEILREVRV